jgi:hypothetical protein
MEREEGGWPRSGMVEMPTGERPDAEAVRRSMVSTLW